MRKYRDTPPFLSQLALEAITDTEAGRDLDWFVCRQARYWESRHEEALARRERRIAYAWFDARRWDEICYLVRVRVFQYLVKQVPEATLRRFENAPTGSDAQLSAAARKFEEFLRDTTEDVCREKLEELLYELRERGLPPYAPPFEPEP